MIGLILCIRFLGSYKQRNFVTIPNALVDVLKINTFHRAWTSFYLLVTSDFLLISDQFENPVYKLLVSNPFIMGFFKACCVKSPELLLILNGPVDPL